LKLQESDFEPGFAACLPETCALILSANLTVHPDVARVILHGSRGPAGGHRPDSDIDLSLIVEALPAPDLERPMHAVIETTRAHWQGAIEPDLAVVFDVGNCGLKCFNLSAWNEQLCNPGGIDCFGLYKTQKGFSGLVSNVGIQVKLMYPCLKIWQRR
jgi:hypothetical protein